MKKNNELSQVETNQKEKVKKVRFPFLKTEKFKQTIRPEAFRIFIVVIATLIYGVGLSWFIEVSAVRLYAGGIPGVAQLIVDFFRVTHLIPDVEAATGTIMFITIIVLNIPIILLGWFEYQKIYNIFNYFGYSASNHNRIY